jgi:NADH:ubiquinone oxidoreductase subunit 5 (subunit L)/multisubunit Na+/H+ antiporter MnhA subunit
MAREFPLWVVVVLPWFAALWALLLARVQVQVLGPRRAMMFAHYLALGASALALLFTVQTIEHLTAPDDPRALAHTPLAELLGPVIVGSVRVDLMLVADRLSACATLLLAGVFTLARMFVIGPAGQRELGIVGEPSSEQAIVAVRRLGVLGLIEGAASLFVLAADLGLAAVGWAVLGLTATLATARGLADERRASAAMRVLATSLAGDLALAAAGAILVFSAIGLAHNEMWAPLTGDRLYALGLLGMPTADVIAILLVAAALLRLTSTAWFGNSLAEALLDAVAIPVTAVYLLLRYQRVLAYAPTVLATVLVLGIVLALVAVAVGLVRPAGGLARRGPRPGVELGLAGTGLAWAGLIAMAIGVGAWRTAVLLVLAHALGRLGLRLALLVADSRLPPWSAWVGRLLCWAVAGIAPGLGFVAMAQVMLDVLTRRSALAPWISWPAAIVVLLVAFAHAAAIARIWYENLARAPGAFEADEDGLDFAPLLLALIGLAVLGVISLGAWFDVTEPILRWLELLLPLAGGHEVVPTGLQPEFRDGLAVARPWVAGCGVLVAIVTGFAWMWARERFRRGYGSELSNLAAALEVVVAMPRRLIGTMALMLDGLTELAARGLGRGLFDEGPRVVTSLARDLGTGVAARARKLGLHGARQAVLGLVVGMVLLLGWLYGKPEVASPWPNDGYGFGGLRPKLIRAGGQKPRAESSAVEAPAAEIEEDPMSTPVAPNPLAPREDGAEP